MFYRRRASPKHRYNIIEEDYGGGGHRTRLIDLKDQLLLCPWGAPLPPYIKEQGGGSRPRERRAIGGSPTPTGSRTPPFLVGEEKRRRGRRKRGLAPLSNSDQRGGAGLLPFGLSPLFPYGPIRPIYSPANSRNSPVLRKNTRITRNLPEVRI